MPIRDTLTRHDLPSEADLRQLLVAELNAPHEGGEPDIIIQCPNPLTTHLFVIWTSFDGLEQVVRSRIILDAFQAARGEQEVRKVTVAMGLTPEEAQRAGLR